MAEQAKGPNPWEPLILLGGILAILFALWWIQGGPQKGSPRGFFINPLAPVGNGDVYGPNFDSYSTSSQETSHNY